MGRLMPLDGQTMGQPAQSMREYPQPHVLAEQMTGVVEATSRHIESLREQLAAAEATRSSAQAALEALNMAEKKPTLGMDQSHPSAVRY
jgi:hypothetical protein